MRRPRHCMYSISAVSYTHLRDIGKDALRSSLGIVLQDTHLFTGTIADNIRYGKLDATMEEVEEAAKLANADSFIGRLPKGYETMVTSDGSNLSQGQRQLLAIARAAVADPPVLILDEATSSIDTRTERLIEKGMDRLMEGRTVFVLSLIHIWPKVLIFDDSTSAVDTATDAKIRKHLAGLADTTKIIIAQRITSVMDSDQIIILEDGEIHAAGTHKSLLESDPIYQELYYSQQKGADEDGKTVSVSYTHLDVYKRQGC